MFQSTPFSDPDFVRRTLTACVQQMASLAGLTAPAFAPGGLSAAALQAQLATAYQQLFTPAAAMAAGATGPGGLAFGRWQKAAERYLKLMGEIAADASARLARALADEAPGAVPVTSLAALHALWIDSGEAAWQAVAHGDEFAEAQAELIASIAALQSKAARA